MKISRNVNRSDGPPPFVPFGQRIKKEQVQELIILEIVLFIVHIVRLLSDSL